MIKIDFKNSSTVINSLGDIIVLADKTIVEIFVNSQKTQITDMGIKWECESDDFRIIHQAISDNNSKTIIKSEIINKSDSDINIEEIKILGDFKIFTSIPFDRAFVTSQTILGPEGTVLIDNPIYSYSFVGLTEKNGQNALFMGFTDLRYAHYNFYGEKTNSDWKMNAVCQREGTSIFAGSSLNISDIVIMAGKSLSDMLDIYGDILAVTMDAIKSEEIKTGWCSWYTYYGQETQEDIIKNVLMLNNSPLKGKIKVIQIDDGWNLPNNDHPRVWGDWTAGPKFPMGMKYIVDIIHENNFEAGLWLAPFSASKDSKLCKEHPDWLIGFNSDNQLKMEDFGLDLTNPEVLKYLKEVFTRVFDEWGFDYIKIDFLLHAVMTRGNRFDNSKTSAESYRDGLKVIKDVADERFVLGCGAPIYPSVGLVDGMRIGPDVGNRWYLPINVNSGWPKGNCAIKPGLYTSLYRSWMNRRLWQNDPDCIVARDYSNEYERNMFGEEFIGHKMADKDYHISKEEAEIWAKGIYFTGGMTLLSEVWDELSDERKAIVESCFPVNEKQIKLVDYYENDEIVVLKTVDNSMLAFFNLTDEDKSVKISSNVIEKKSWIFKEHFDGEVITGDGDIIDIEIPLRSAKVFDIK